MLDDVCIYDVLSGAAAYLGKLHTAKYDQAMAMAQLNMGFFSGPAGWWGSARQHCQHPSCPAPPKQCTFTYIAVQSWCTEVVGV